MNASQQFDSDSKAALVLTYQLRFITTKTLKSKPISIKAKVILVAIRS